MALLFALAPPARAASPPGQPFSPSQVAIEVKPGSAVQRAGLQKGDRLVGWNGSLPQVGWEGTLGPFALEFFEVEVFPRRGSSLRVTRGKRESFLALSGDNLGLQALPEWGKATEELRRGEELFSAKNPAEGQALLDSAAGTLEMHRDLLAAAWVRNRCVQNLFRAAKWKEALGELELAQAALGRAGGDHPFILCRILHSKAYASGKLGEIESMRASFHLALEALGEKGRGTLTEASAQLEIGGVLRERGAYPEAKVALTRAVDLTEQLAPGTVLLVNRQTSLAACLRNMGELEGAESLYREAGAFLERAAPESVAMATCLNGLGLVAMERGDLAGAETAFQQALALFEKLQPGTLRLASVLNNLGIIAEALGDLDRAEALHRQALALRERLDPTGFEACGSLLNLGEVLRLRGDLATAEACYQKAYETLTQTAPASPNLGHALNNLGIISLLRGEGEEAEARFEKALAVRERIAPVSMAVAQSFGNLAGAAREQGEQARALEYCLRSYEMKQKIAPESLDVVASLDGLGQIQMDGGELGAAQASLTRAEEMAKAISPQGMRRAEVLGHLALLEIKRGNLLRAQAANQESVEILQRIAPASQDLAMVLQQGGEIRGALGHPREQEELWLRAIQCLEEQRGRLGGGATTSESFSAKFADLYRQFVALEVRLGRPEKAFSILERFRARSLLQLLAERDLDFSKDAPAELLREQKRAEFETQRLQGDIAELDPVKDEAKLQTLLARLTELRTARREIGERIRQASPALASLQYPQPLELDGVRGILPRGVLLLTYCVGPKETTLFALLDGKLQVVSIPAGRKELRRRVSALRCIIRDGGISGGEARWPHRKLYDLLIAPVKGMVHRADLLLLCPDGPLHALPFASLQAPDGSYLVEAKPLAFTVSATIFAELQRRDPSRQMNLELCAFGDPDGPKKGGEHPKASGQELPPLPFARREVEEICRPFGDRAKSYVGAEATVERVEQEDDQCHLLHFACHAVLNERFPLDSGLALAPPAEGTEGGGDGMLQAWEVFERMRMDTDLVILSACESGLGKEMGGEGLIGLTRAFFYAGSRSVLSTLWSVSDDSTARFMGRFYGYLRAGETKPEALRKAQLDLIHPGRHGKSTEPSVPPFAWGAFVLSGQCGGLPK